MMALVEPPIAMCTLMALSKAAAVLADVPPFNAAADELRITEERAQSARARLAAAIGEQAAIVVDGSIDMVLGQARGLLDRARERAAERDKLELGAEEARRAREGAERLLNAHEAAAAAWRESWRAAVADIGGLHLSGLVAWFIWLFVHLMYLVEFANRILVFIQWGFLYLTYNRGARLITGQDQPVRAEAPEDVDRLVR